jgi:hypothetical protein
MRGNAAAKHVHLVCYRRRSRIYSPLPQHPDFQHFVFVRSKKFPSLQLKRTLEISTVTYQYLLRTSLLLAQAVLRLELLLPWTRNLILRARASTSCLARGVREGLLDAAKASVGLGATTVIDQALCLETYVLVQIWYVSTSAVILRSHPSWEGQRERYAYLSLWKPRDESSPPSATTPSSISTCPHGDLGEGTLHARGRLQQQFVAELSQNQTQPRRSLLYQAQRDPSRLSCS